MHFRCCRTLYHIKSASAVEYVDCRFANDVKIQLVVDVKIRLIVNVVKIWLVTNDVKIQLVTNDVKIRLVATI